MKHNLKITIILLVMFFITQLIGLAVIKAYSPRPATFFNETTGQYENITIKTELPYGMQPPEMKPEVSIASIVVSMIIAIFLIFLLMKIKATLFLKLWFFFVVVLALALSINSALLKFNLSPYLALIPALPLAFFKIFKRDLLVHNLTELLIYPGIAAVFVPILIDNKRWLSGKLISWGLNISSPLSNLLATWPIIIILILISVYDIYAVWHSGFMQKMAKFQINQLGIFTGFFLPYADKKTKEKIQFLKQKYKNKIPQRIIKKQKIKISLAILGGGDVVFPIILAGVVLRSLGFYQALVISVFATLSLLYLFIFAKKGKFYPAMPYLTAGCLLGLLVAWLI